MQFLWKSQLRREKGRLLPKNSVPKKKTSRKEKLHVEHDKRKAYFGVTFLWILFLGTIIYVMFFSPYLTLTDVRTASSQEDQKIAVEKFVVSRITGKYFGIFPRNNFFLTFPKRLENNIQSEFPLVKDVQIKRVFPDTLMVELSPREKLVVWCTGLSCYHVLENGTIREKTALFDQGINQEQTLTIRDMSEKSLDLNSHPFPETFVPFVVSLKEGFQNRLGIEIEDSFTVSSRFAEELRVKTLAGWEIYVSTKRPLDTTLNSLGVLFEKEITEEKRSYLKYIDLRTENRMYYVFREGTVPSGEMVVESEKKSEEKTEKKKNGSKKK